MDKEMRGSLLKDADRNVAICTLCETEFHIQLFDMDNFCYCPYCGSEFEGGTDDVKT